MKYNYLIAVLFFGVCTLSAQEKYEREHRIKKSEFPTAAYTLIKEKVSETKKLKFYKEIDSAKTSYIAKCKKGRLWYDLQFDNDGNLQNTEVTIKSIDMPNETYDNIITHLDTNYNQYKIQKIQQQYVTDGDIEKTMKNTFQNLMLPSVNYKLFVAAKKVKEKQEFEILFNADGIFKHIRRALPPNYDHVLY
tara:strand:- start:28077 stop:28652 length:576 start_codon:yes stop_codon:yes gene_type:complete